MNPLSLESTLSAARCLRDLGNWILIIFLVIEILPEVWPELRPDWSPWSPPSKYSFWLDNHARCKPWITGGAAIMVVAGVTLEMWAGTRIDKIVDQMRLEMGPRTELLYGVRREKLEARIRRFKGQHVETRYCSQYEIPPFNEEAMGVALILPFVLKEAGWNAPDAIPVHCGGFGISIAVSAGASHRTREAAEALRMALNKLPIEVVGDKVWDVAPGSPPPSESNSVVILVLSHPQ
jgi:hypothetical protein